jgi:nicotinamidase-related amidase
MPTFLVTPSQPLDVGPTPAVPIGEDQMDGRTMKTALVCIDFINDVIGDGGKLAAKGYSSFAGRHKTFDHLRDLQTRARGQGTPVIHVGLGFDVGYLGFPEASPLLGGAMAAHALALGSWGTEFLAGVGPVDHDIALRKPRISALSGTRLQSILSGSHTERLVLAGVATDITVLSTAFSAHDLDFRVVVVSDACAAASDQDHENALIILRKVASVVTAEDL